MSTPSYRFVDTPAALAEAAQALRGSSQLYLDTEFDSSRQGTQLCLLQISGGEQIFLIDTLRLGALEPLRPLLEQEGVSWILHAGLQDVQLLQERLQIQVPSALFDTQIAWALLSAESNVSLAYLQYRLLGVRSDKAHQADDWVRRPLGDSQLRYAASDVEYLPRMVESLQQKAREKNRLEIIYQASHEALLPVRKTPAPLRLESFRNAWQLGAPNQAALQFLIDWYNALSPQDKKYAPENKVLLSLAGRLPENPQVLSRIKGISPGFAQHHGKRLISGLLQAARSAQSSDWTPIDPPPYASFEEIRLEAWLGLLRAEICHQLEVSPELVLPARLISELKQKLLESPTQDFTEVFQGYRKTLLTEPVQQFCAAHPPPLPISS